MNLNTHITFRSLTFQLILIYCAYIYAYMCIHIWNIMELDWIKTYFSLRVVKLKCKRNYY